MATQCAICERPIAPRADNVCYPLCSERCRLVDLGKWLGENYAIVGQPTNDYGSAHFEREEEEL